MALTRKALVAMGIESEKIDQIIEMHSEVVEALKTERDNAKKYKEDSDKLASVQKELDDLKTAQSKPDAYKAKYDELKKEYDTYKGEIAAKETKAAKSKAYKQMLKDIRVSDKYIDSVMRVADYSSIELDENGAIKDLDGLKESATNKWSDFIESTGTVGARTPAPPSNKGGAKTKEEIMNIKDTSERQAAIAENHELFGF